MTSIPKCRHGIPVVDLCDFVEQIGLGVDQYRFKWPLLEFVSEPYPSVEALVADNPNQIGGVIQRQTVWKTDWEVEA